MKMTVGSIFPLIVALFSGIELSMIAVVGLLWHAHLSD